MTLLGVWNTKITTTARAPEPPGHGMPGVDGEASKTTFFELAVKHESIAVNEAAPGVAVLHSHSAGRAETNLTIGNPP